MTDHVKAKASADKAQSLVGHKVTYHDGGVRSDVREEGKKLPEINENKWMDENSSREKIKHPKSQDRMPSPNEDVFNRDVKIPYIEEM